MPVQGNSNSLNPSLLIWACGGWKGEWISPPPHWQPQAVVDLSYNEDSPAKDYAQKLALPYHSGHSMFIRQAAFQRTFLEKTSPYLKAGKIKETNQRNERNQKERKKIWEPIVLDKDFA